MVLLSTHALSCYRPSTGFARNSGDFFSGKGFLILLFGFMHSAWIEHFQNDSHTSVRQALRDGDFLRLSIPAHVLHCFAIPMFLCTYAHNYNYVVTKTHVSVLDDPRSVYSTCSRVMPVMPVLSLQGPDNNTPTSLIRHRVCLGHALYRHHH